MREREFWELLEEVFGRTYGRSLSRDQRMPKLANMTVVEALDAGEEPRVVWNVLCDQMEVPDSKRWGHDREIGDFGVLHAKFEQMFVCVVIVIHSDKKPHTCAQGACHLP